MERRRTVAEDKAKRNVSRLLKFLIVVLVIGALVWFVLSPWLSVTQVSTTGITESDAHAILVDHGVMAGTPMIRLDVGGVEQALENDPWISDANVERHWPDQVVVMISERVPVAWSHTRGGWTRRAIDGQAIPSSSRPDVEMVRIDFPTMTDTAAAGSEDMLAALEFADALSNDLRRGTVITRFRGELWASVSGFQVRLGRGIEMRAKALSLEALMSKEIPADSILVLIAPTNPAVMTPGDDETANSPEAALQRGNSAEEGNP